MFIILFSCSADSNQTIERKEKGSVIDLDNANANSDDYFLYSSMYKSVKTILLETNESCLIGFIKKMRVYDPYIIILDSYVAKSVLIFDMNGRFIRKIGNVGPGPGEYTRPFDFTVDKEGNAIYVIDGHLSRINKYDLNTGRFIHSINYEKDVRSFNIEYVGGKLFADAYFSKHSDNNYLIRIIEEPSGKIAGNFLNVKEYGKGISNTSFIRDNVFYPRENSRNVVFVQPLMDQIIELSSESVSSLFEIKSKDAITPEIIKTAMEKNQYQYMMNLMQYNKYFHISGFIEHGNRIIFDYQKGNKFKLILYNKQTHEVGVFQNKWNDLFFLNKGTGTYPVPKVGCFDSSGVYYYYDTSRLSRIQQLAVTGALSPELDKLDVLKNLEEDANPMIFYYEFKD